MPAMRLYTKEEKNGMNMKSCFVMSSNYYEFFAVAVFFCFMENARIKSTKRRNIVDIASTFYEGL